MTWVLFGAFLLGSTTAAEESAERQQLIERRAQLQEKVRALQEEQGLLVFRKRMYSADSKYLILDLSAGKGSLWYRNRVLMNFPLRVLVREQGKGADIVAVTEHSSWGEIPRFLLFSDRLVLTTGKGPRSKRAAAVRAAISSRNMTSLLSVLDKGSLAYLLP